MRRRSIYRNWFRRHIRGQGFGYAAITLAALTAIASGTVTASERMSISGTQIFDSNGVPFIPRGMVAGHGELVREGDEAASAAMGANIRRIGIRWWTDDTTGFQTDAESDANPGHLDPAYWARTLAQIYAARAAGLKVHLFFDTNCGQGIGTGAVCKLDGTNVVDFASNTALSNAKRAKYIEMIVWVISQTIGLVDSIEGLVEPAGNFTQTSYWDLAEDIMDAVLPVDPHMIFYWGGYPNYQATAIGSALRPGWNDIGSPYRNHLVATCNTLTNLATNPTQRVDRVNNYIVPARVALGAPVVIQQCGTRTDDDPTDSHLDAMLTLLDQAAGGPIGYMGWEETSVYATSYGFNSLSNTSDPNSSRIVKTGRKAVWQAHFTGSFVNAAITLGALTSTAAGTRGHAGTLAATLSPLTVVGAGNAGGGATTVLDLRMLGGQIDTPLDYSGLTMYQDLAKCARNFAKDVTGLRYQEATTQIKILSLTRVSNVVSVVLREAPAVEHPGQDIATGFRLVLTCLQDPTFDVDHAEITVSDQTHFTYQTTGQANGSYATVSEYDVPATIINSVRVGADGQPIEDFCSVLSTVNGSATAKHDLDGTYVGTFPPGAVLPTGMTFDGAALTWGGGSTFSLVIDSVDSAFIAMHCSGVSTGFKMPRIIRNDMDTTGATLLRPDFVEFFGRFLGVLRCMDAGRTNSNSWIKSWAKRPVVACGMGMTLEDMVRACNELGCDLWYCFPHWADDDYVTRTATYIRDNLSASLNVEFEYVNEEWNDGTFPHPMWLLTRLRKRLKAHFHGVYNENCITGVSRSGGVVTVSMNRPPNFPNGSTVVFKITAGSTGYDTSDTGAVATVSGNSFSFTGGSASGAGTCTRASVIGVPSDPIYAWDKSYGYRELFTRMHGERTYQVGQLVKAVFGGVLNGRARMLLMGWHTNFVPSGNLEEYALKWLEAQYGSTRDWIWGIGGAPYPQPLAGDTTPAAVKARILSVTDSQEINYHRASYVAHRYAHQHIQYEGGPDITFLGTNFSLIDSLYSASEYRDAQAYVLNKALAFGVDVHVPFYTSMAFPGTQGRETWGVARTLALDKTIGSASTSRVQGIDDVLLAAPPAYADPNKLPGTLYFQGGSGYIDDTSGTGATNGMRQFFSTSAQCEDLFFVDPADDGNDIDITIWGGCVVGGGSNGVRVYLDDVLLGTHNLATTSSLASMANGGSASPTTFTLPAVSAGKHRLKIKSPTSMPDEVGVSKVVGV